MTTTSHQITFKRECDRTEEVSWTKDGFEFQSTLITAGNGSYDRDSGCCIYYEARYPISQILRHIQEWDCI